MWGRGEIGALRARVCPGSCPDGLGRVNLAVGPQASLPSLPGLSVHNLGTVARRPPHKAAVSAKPEEAEKAPREPQLPSPLCVSIVLIHSVTLRE